MRKICLLVVSLLCVYANAEKRNPFALPQQHKQAKKSKAVVLEGIVHCKGKQCAVLSNGSLRDMVPVQGTFDGHTIREIGKNFVVVSKNERTQKIRMD